MKFNIILTMGGEFYLPLQRFYNGVGGVVNFELWILNWAQAAALCRCKVYVAYKKLWQTLKVCQRVYFEF